jgi:CDP-diacylglycerol---glycerol-3-phosphate 3-phosphatidyltransferase
LIGAKIGHALDPVILKAYRVFFRHRSVNPNIFTLSGLFFSVIAALCAAFHLNVAAGAMLVAAGLCDLVDGALARNTHTVTLFGGFLDSVIDRYSDLVVMLGVAYAFLSSGNELFVMITFVAAIGTAVIPYARAKAEAASVACNTGFFERPERLVILMIGFFFGLLPYAIAVLAVGTHVTVLQRILFVRRRTAEQDLS